MTSSIASKIAEGVLSPEMLHTSLDEFETNIQGVLGSTTWQPHDLFPPSQDTDHEESVEGTGKFIQFSDSVQILVETRGNAGKILEIMAAYERRIGVLKMEAALDGFPFNHASEMAFSEFFARNPFLRYGSLFLMENGNLRAIWKGEEGAHVGLQFLGNGSVQYVIFKHRQPSLPVSRVCGCDTVDGIRRQIDAFDLGNVLYRS